jgi:hypothetical protein
MAMDLLIYLGGCALLALYFFVVGKPRRKAVALVPVVDLVSVRARLAADHRERLSRADVSTVRDGDGRVDRPRRLSLEQRARIARVEERKKP